MTRPATPPHPAHQPPLRVLYCHPGAQMYGSDRMALQTVAMLEQSGMRVTTVLPETGELLTRLRAQHADVRLLRVPVLRKSLLRPAGFARFAAQSWAGLRRARRGIRHLGINVVVVNTLTQPVWILAARLAGVPVLCHVREAEAALPRLLRGVLVSPLSLCGLVLSNSWATDAFLHTSCLLLLPLPPTRVVYNGKDWSGYLRSEPRPLGSGGPVHLVLVGRISPRKGQDTAIEALRQLRLRGVDARLRLVGDVFTGYEWFETALRKSVQTAGLGEYCTFSGFVGDVADELQRADIVLVPSRVEPFGTVAAEGMAAKRVTVVSHVQGLTEIVQNGISGIVVDPENPSSWADAVASLVADPSWALELARAGHERVSRVFSAAAYADGVLRAVHDVARGRRAPALSVVSERAPGTEPTRPRQQAPLAHEPRHRSAHDERREGHS